MFPCLNVFYTTRSKIRNCVSRALERDIFDIRFLFEKLGKEIGDVRHEFDQDEVDEFLEFYFGSAVPAGAVEYYRRVLTR